MFYYAKYYIDKSEVKYFVWGIMVKVLLRYLYLFLFFILKQPVYTRVIKETKQKRAHLFAKYFGAELKKGEFEGKFTRDNLNPQSQGLHYDVS